MASSVSTPAPSMAEALRRARVAKGLTQRDAAEAIGVSPNTVGRWEQGVFEPAGAVRIRALEFYELTDHVLIPGSVLDDLRERLTTLEEAVAELRRDRSLDD